MQHSGDQRPYSAFSSNLLNYKVMISYSYHNSTDASFFPLVHLQDVSDLHEQPLLPSSLLSFLLPLSYTPYKELFKRTSCVIGQALETHSCIRFYPMHYIILNKRIMILMQILTSRQKIDAAEKG
ncbi:predicted protein [Methanosarcina acetivorans C2A]|uniref:Uncharacterized protein n=1 Tax=Methanosarcina acetivorans (strain ATCC 35395 / DSM 2834 / JCM 12185 / C2A) TaxID=188937 RepID=Q8TTS6_METAC|nr:predicted protein [Methanosarcina acetivorans C2A]